MLGQPDFTSNTGACSTTGESIPNSVFSDGTRLFVTDQGCNRVLIFNSIPTGNAQPANVVVGHSSFTSGGNGTGAKHFNTPNYAYSDGTRLFVADQENERVLIWNSIPTTNDASANLVLGQADLTSESSGSFSASTITTPEYVAEFNGHLYVADGDGNRIMIWNSLPTTNNQAADMVVGQPDATVNWYLTLDAFHIFNPTGLWTDGTKLWIGDYGHSRVLVMPMP